MLRFKLTCGTAERESERGGGVTELGNFRM
jgi:hypothetical protein